MILIAILLSMVNYVHDVGAVAGVTTFNDVRPVCSYILMFDANVFFDQYHSIALKLVLHAQV